MMLGQPSVNGHLERDRSVDMIWRELKLDLFLRLHASEG